MVDVFDSLQVGVASVFNPQTGKKLRTVFIATSDKEEQEIHFTIPCAKGLVLSLSKAIDALVNDKLYLEEIDDAN